MSPLRCSIILSSIPANGTVYRVCVDVKRDPQPLSLIRTASATVIATLDLAITASSIRAHKRSPNAADACVHPQCWSIGQFSSQMRVFPLEAPKRRSPSRRGYAGWGH